MANSRSARKNVRKSETNRARNRWRLTRVRTGIREFLHALHHGTIDEAGTKLRGLYKLLDQIASTHVIHKKTASRYKSRLTIRFNAQKAKGTPAPAAA